MTLNRRKAVGNGRPARNSSGGWLAAAEEGGTKPVIFEDRPCVVLEGIPAIVLFGPLLFPIAKAVGVHEVHYAMIIILAMGMGLFAPPFGVGYYAACAIGRVDPAEGIRPILGYMLALLVGLIVVAAFPWISIGFLK